MVTAGVANVEARLGVEEPRRKVHAHSPEGVHHIGEGVEVEFDVVVDRNAEVLFDGRHQLTGALVEGGVNLVRALETGVRNKKITGDGEEGHLVGRGVDVHDHVDVGVHPGHALATEPVRGVLNRERAATRRSDEENVDGVRMSGTHRLEMLDHLVVKE